MFVAARAAVVALALGALAVAPGAALARGSGTTSTQRYVLVAYGMGTPTTCTITVEKFDMWFKDYFEFFGKTDCSVPVQQSGQAWMGGMSMEEYGWPCSGFTASCSSGGSAQGNYNRVYYHVTLIAPYGQGWVAHPEQCSGAGSDNLECTFSVGFGGL